MAPPEPSQAPEPHNPQARQIQLKYLWGWVLSEPLGTIRSNFVLRSFHLSLLSFSLNNRFFGLRCCTGLSWFLTC